MKQMLPELHRLRVLRLYPGGFGFRVQGLEVRVYGILGLGGFKSFQSRAMGFGLKTLRLCLESCASGFIDPFQEAENENISIGS